ncbi:glycosyltransferase [Roseobacter sp.]|uniref:glycosyltransferase family protein n=1 Tax=Roseobacter sp. TaxID=1907202 RepID=UPI0032974C0F
MKVAFLVTHLLGTGHLARALTLARACRDAGHDATVLSGGVPAPHLDATGLTLVQLPPLRSDGTNFTQLRDAAGDTASADHLRARQTMIRRALSDIAPDVLVTELFPFGRRVLAAEFLTAVETAHALPRPAVICASIRDILAPPSKPAKADKTHAILDQFYDAVLVHSDPDVTPLDVSWPVTPTLAARLHYTGFVAPPAALPHPQALGAGEILVSAGGGDVGTDLFYAALHAATANPAQQWRLLVGGADAPARVADLRAHAPANAHVEPARPDFRQMLHHVTASVSMAGYNTALDLLQTGAPAVLVPFDAGGETEQTLRAQALAHWPGVAVLPTAKLSADTLRDGLARALQSPRRPPLTQGLDGAAETVRILDRLRANNDS